MIVILADSIHSSPNEASGRHREEWHVPGRCVWEKRKRYYDNRRCLADHQQCVDSHRADGRPNAGSALSCGGKSSTAKITRRGNNRTGSTLKDHGEGRSRRDKIISKIVHAGDVLLAAIVDDRQHAASCRNFGWNKFVTNLCDRFPCLLTNTVRGVRHHRRRRQLSARARTATEADCPHELRR